MKDKFTKLIMAFIVVAIFGVIGVFGIIIYNEINGIGTLTSLDPIPITIGNGGGVGSSGGVTKFGSYITADGGKPGSAGWASAASTNNSTPGTGGAGGHVGGVTTGGAGWTVKAYT